MQGLTKFQTDFLVLNSLSFFDKTLQQMQKYKAVNLFLDRDRSGIRVTRKAILWVHYIKNVVNYIKDSKDLNNKLTAKK